MNSILHLTLLDRTRKKIAFVRRAALLLGLNNCHPAWGSAGPLPPAPGERFDAVVGARRRLHCAPAVPRPAPVAPARKPLAAQAAG